MHQLDVLQMSQGQQFSWIMQSGRVRFALLTGANVFGETKPPVDRALAISIQEVCPEKTKNWICNMQILFLKLHLEIPVASNCC